MEGFDINNGTIVRQWIAAVGFSQTAYILGVSNTDLREIIRTARIDGRSKEGAKTDNISSYDDKLKFQSENKTEQT
ncbi:hypothetical protein OAF54_01715 [bacterium]|nr:hypothetical protein [bacterium]